MNYSIATLTNAADCQVVLDMANTEKGNLQFRKTSIERQRASATVTSEQLSTDLAAINAELSVLETIYPTLPEGSTKQDMLKKITKHKYDKFLIEQRKENYGPATLLGKEFDLACVEHSITEVDDYIGAVTVRMAQV